MRNPDLTHQSDSLTGKKWTPDVIRKYASRTKHRKHDMEFGEREHRVRHCGWGQRQIYMRGEDRALKRSQSRHGDCDETERGDRMETELEKESDNRDTERTSFAGFCFGSSVLSPWFRIVWRPSREGHGARGRETHFEEDKGVA